MFQYENNAEVCSASHDSSGDLEHSQCSLSSQERWLEAASHGRASLDSRSLLGHTDPGWLAGQRSAGKRSKRPTKHPICPHASLPLAHTLFPGCLTSLDTLCSKICIRYLVLSPKQPLLLTVCWLPGETAPTLSIPTLQQSHSIPKHDGRKADQTEQLIQQTVQLSCNPSVVSTLKQNKQPSQHG